MPPVKRVALIIGISGQDGGLLAEHLVADGTIVHGTSRDAELNEFRNLRRLGVFDKVRLHSANTTDLRSIIRVLEKTQPDEVYNLAGQSSVGLSFDQPIETYESIIVATANILESIRALRAPIRFFNAVSSDCFGDTGPEGADETTPFRPRSPYGIAKAAAFWAVDNHRDAYGLFATSGILFNHESPLRPERFVTQKIVRAAARIARGETKAPLRLGNLDIRRDWGWAPEYVQAIKLMLRHETPADFVVATGESHPLAAFAEQAFAAFGLDWRQHVVSDPELMRPSDIAISLGRPTRAREVLGWQAETRMPDIVRRLAAAAAGSGATTG